MKRPDRTTEVLMHTLMQRRVDLILQRPFFGSLCMKLEVVVDRKHDAVGWTDGKRLGVHPERFMALSIDEQTTLIAHEVMHCVMGHPWRQGARALDDWNIACDHAVNLTLRKAGMSVPETWCCDAQFENMSAEAIYSRIQQMRPNPQPEDDSGTGEDDAGDDDGDSDEQSQAPAPGASESAADESSDDVSHGETPAAPGASDSDSGDDESAAGTSEANAGDANGGGDDGNIVPQPETAPNAQQSASSENKPTTFGGGPGGVCAPQQDDDGADVPRGTDTPEQQHADWQAATEAAAMIARQQGEGAGWLDFALEQSRKPKIDWTAETRRFMQQIAASDYSWRVPNRRFMSRGLIMPALAEPSMGPMVVVRDTSGSCMGEAAQFTAEVAAIIDEIKPECVHVIDADWIVQRSVEIERGDDMPDVLQRSVGGGGTSFVPPFELVEQQGIQPACLVYLTDLWGDFPKAAPDYPVLWICTSDERRVPFGEVVPMN